MTEVVIQISDRKKPLFFNTCCWDKWVSIQGEKNETGTLSSTTYKNKLEINLNITPETIKYLVENEDKSP